MLRLSLGYCAPASEAELAVDKEILVPRLSRARLSTKSEFQLSSEDTILVTGGAKGVTFALLRC